MHINIKLFNSTEKIFGQIIKQSNKVILLKGNQGKTILAHKVVSALLKQDIKSQHLFNNNIHPDLLIIEKNISFDEIRKINEFASTLPILDDKKIVIIDGIDTIKNPSILLKITEEPPEYLYIILTSKTDISPILSHRVVSYCIPQPTLEEVAEELQLNLEDVAIIYDVFDRSIKLCKMFIQDKCAPLILRLFKQGYDNNMRDNLLQITNYDIINPCLVRYIYTKIKPTLNNIRLLDDLITLTMDKYLNQRNLLYYMLNIVAGLEL